MKILGTAKAYGVYLKPASFHQSLTAQSSPHTIPINLGDKLVTAVSDQKRPNSSHPGVMTSLQTLSNRNSGVQGYRRIKLKPKVKDRQINSSVSTPNQTTTINNYVHITTIADPAKLPVAHFSKPTIITPSMPVSKESTKRPNFHSRRLSVKTSDHIRKKSDVGLNQSFNANIHRLLKESVSPAIKNSVIDPLNQSASNVLKPTVIVTKYAFYSKVGLAPTNPDKQNQDSFYIQTKIGGKPKRHLFGVADGHGQFGKEVSTLIKYALPRFLTETLIISNPTEAFKNSYHLTSDEIKNSGLDIEFSGSTCVSVLIDDDKLYCANVGDSRAIICSVDRMGGIKGKALSRDHKPDEPDEAQRIINNNGRIAPFTGIFR